MGRGRKGGEKGDNDGKVKKRRVKGG